MNATQRTRSRNVGSVLGAAALAVLVVAAAAATSTSYVLQPELRVVAADLGSSVSTIGVVAGAAILGYLLGLALLVPLADRVRPSRLVPAQLAGLAVAMGAAALTPSTPLLALALLASGLCASTGAQMSTLAARFAPAGRRGQAVGIVTAGISAGIVLGRIVGGALADALGWRGMLLAFVAVSCVLALAALVSLPSVPMHPTRPYVRVIAGTPHLLHTDRLLRRSALAGASWFFAFSITWVGVSLALTGPPLSLSATTVGLYALAGLLGVAVTPFAGRLSDRFGRRRVVVAGLFLAAASTVGMAFTLQVPVVTLAGLALFDAGLFAAQVANQSGVLSIDPQQAGQYNSAYMVVYFVGGSIGTAVGGTLVERAGWVGVCVAALLAIGVAVTVSTRR